MSRETSRLRPPSAEIQVKVIPRSSRNRHEWSDGALKLWVTAPPTDGQANQAVCAAVAKLVGVAPSFVTVKRGDTSRVKLLSVEGLTTSELNSRLESL